MAANSNNQMKWPATVNGFIAGRKCKRAAKQEGAPVLLEQGRPHGGLHSWSKSFLR